MGFDDDDVTVATEMDPHAECRAEIHRLEQANTELTKLRTNDRFATETTAMGFTGKEILDMAAKLAEAQATVTELSWDGALNELEGALAALSSAVVCTVEGGEVDVEFDYGDGKANAAAINAAAEAVEEEEEDG